MISGLDSFQLVREMRFPPPLAEIRVHFARDRHDIDARHDPGVNLSEAEDFRAVVVVSAAALILVACIGRGTDHAERPAARRAEEPPAPPGFDRRVNVGHIIGVISRRCDRGPGIRVVIDFDFRKADVRADAVNDLQFHPGNRARLKDDRLARSVVRNGADVFSRTITEFQNAGRHVFLERRPVVDDHLVDSLRHLPVELKRRVIDPTVPGIGTPTDPFAGSVLLLDTVNGRLQIRSRPADGGQRRDIVRGVKETGFGGEQSDQCKRYRKRMTLWRLHHLGTSFRCKVSLRGDPYDLHIVVRRGGILPGGDSHCDDMFAVGQTSSQYHAMVPFDLGRVGVELRHLGRLAIDQHFRYATVRTDLMDTGYVLASKLKAG